MKYSGRINRRDACRSYAECRQLKNPPGYFFCFRATFLQFRALFAFGKERKTNSFNPERRNQKAKLSSAQYENHDPASIAGTPQHSILCRKKEFQILRNFASRFPLNTFEHEIWTWRGCLAWGLPPLFQTGSCRQIPR